MWRPLARFFVVGALLFAARQAVHAVEPPRRSLTVEVPAGASEAAVAAAVDEAILFDRAVRAEWHRSDAVVRERLVSTLAVAGETESNPRVAVERAIRLGVHARDPIARRRLVEAAARALEHGEGEDEPTAEELAAYVAAHPDAFRSPGRIRFRQIFLSAERRGSGLAGAVAEVAARLASEPSAPPEELLALTDPWPWSDTRGGESPERLDALFGSGFGRALSGARPGRWEGPFSSSFGRHFVWIDAKETPDAPPIGAVREKARAAVLRERRAERLAGRMAALRREYDVVVVRTE